MNKTITLESPDANLRVDLSIETLWVGNTVYPSAAVLHCSYRGYKVLEDAALSIGEILYGVEIIGVEESTSNMRLGVAHQKVVRLRERGGDGRCFDLIVRVSDVSVFFDLNPVGGNVKSQTVLPQFVKNAPILSQPGELPLVAYVGPGALAAEWLKKGAVHLVIFSRPGQLAEMRFNLLDAMEELDVKSGSDGCRLLYTKLPFVTSVINNSVFSDDIRISYRRAFDRLLEHYAAEDDDFWVMRGEPGVFAVIARRVDSKWIVCGLTDAARTLTLRFEEMWLRMPPEMRSLEWRATVHRDPVLDEPGDIVEEQFDNLAPDVRIAMDLKKNGGFVIEFEPKNLGTLSSSSAGRSLKGED